MAKGEKFYISKTIGFKNLIDSDFYISYDGNRMDSTCKLATYFILIDSISIPAVYGNELMGAEYMPNHLIKSK